MKILFQSILVLLSLHISSVLSAQAIKMTAAQEEKIDALFEEWNKTDAPGVSVGVLSGNEVLYLKNYGSADLKRNKAISSDTKFRLTGMSSHFTAFAVFLLEDRKQLKLEDDIRKYLPELPKRKEIITIQHLLHHSSGLPGYWPIKELAGFGETAAFNEEDALALYKYPWELNNKPGEKFIYTATGASLLAKIVAKVAGQSFSEFTKKEIFVPLDMHNSSFVEEHNTPDNLAVSYSFTQNTFQPRSIKQSDTGAVGFICTMDDLMKWYKNLRSPKIGSARMMQQLDESMQLENGSFAEWPRGRTTYGQEFMHAERGINKIWNSGTFGGYASSVFRFPSQELTIAVFSNTGMLYNGSLGMETADILLADKFEKETSPQNKTPNYTKLSATERTAFLGDYYDASTYSQRQIILRNDTLRYYRPNYDSESTLLPISEKELHMLSPYGYYTVHLTKTGNKKGIDIRIEDQSYVYEKYEKVAYSTKELNEFAGTYYSDALKTSLNLWVKEGQLYASNNHIEAITLNAFRKNQFIGTTSFFKLARFQRNAKGEIIGFDLSQEEFKQIRFRRI